MTLGHIPHSIHPQKQLLQAAGTPLFHFRHFRFPGGMHASHNTQEVASTLAAESTIENICARPPLRSHRHARPGDLRLRADLPRRHQRHRHGRLRRSRSRCHGHCPQCRHRRLQDSPQLFWRRISLSGSSPRHLQRHRSRPRLQHRQDRQSPGLRRRHLHSRCKAPGLDLLDYG